MDAITLLKNDHRKVEELFRRFNDGGGLTGVVKRLTGNAASARGSTRGPSWIPAPPPRGFGLLDAASAIKNDDSVRPARLPIAMNIFFRFLRCSSVGNGVGRRRGSPPTIGPRALTRASALGRSEIAGRADDSDTARAASTGCCMCGGTAPGPPGSGVRAPRKIVLK